MSPNDDVKLDPNEAFRRGTITFATYRDLKRQLQARPKNQLCSVCRSIDFETLYSGKRVVDADRACRSVILGTHQDLSTRGLLCVFCRWIAQNIEHHQDRGHGLRYLGARKIKLCCDGSTVYNGYERGPHSVSGHLIPIVRLRAEPFDYDRDMLADLRLVKQPQSNASIPKPLTGELVDSQTTTIEQFKLWLQDCLKDHEHGDNENLPEHHPKDRQVETLENIPGFAVIDVVQRRLVGASTLEQANIPYIALSYVWGYKSAAITLGPDNALPEDLPRTIEDTLTLVSGLGCVPYLWIDSICIPQDDLEVRIAQIQKMDVIYDRALATIITTGASMRYGLTGISVNPNPAQSLQLGPWLLMYQPSPWKHLMCGTNDAASHFLPWGSRAWTFQEALISRRKLILNNADDRLLFECSASGRQTHPTDAFEKVRARFFDDIETVRRPEMDGWNLHWYQHLLNLYLRRTLSYDRDIISAFTGVAKVISRAIGKREDEGKTCWTVPRREFLGGLMWAPPKNCQELKYRHEMLDDGRKIPSWHWASVVMGEGVAFVEGSEPGQMYEGLRDAWTIEWTNEEWEEAERTGRVAFQGEVVDFDKNAEDFLPTVGRQEEGEQGTHGDDGDCAVHLSRALESLRLDSNRDVETLVDKRQCAMNAWQERRGCFISCGAWAWAGTLDEVNEPNAIYPYAHRLGNPKPMQLNRRFVLMVDWVGCRHVPQMAQYEKKTLRVCKRLGWAVVDLEAWQANGPFFEKFWLA